VFLKKRGKVKSLSAIAKQKGDYVAAIDFGNPESFEACTFLIILIRYPKLKQTPYICIPISKTFMKNLFFVLPLVAFAAACGNKESAQLQSQVDSLRSVLETNQRVAQTLQEVGVLMDSIDANRQLLRVNMVEGTTYDNYTSRMEDLNNYVKDTENKIADLEKALKKSKGVSGTYAATIKKLKEDLASKNTEIALLQEQVEKYRNENQNLIQTVGLQEAEIADKDEQLAAKRSELALIEARIQEIMLQSKMSEADAYYARAVAVEEAANRTKLAPRKKKETYQEALELYKKAQSLGSKDAAAKITELEKKI
jgi:chromosome segregation ATPase